MAREVKIQISGDPTSAQRAFKATEKSAETFGGKLLGLGKTSSTVAGGLNKLGGASAVLGGVLGGSLVTGAAQAGRAMLSMVQDGIQGLREAERVAAQTNAVIRSTGGAANVAQSEVKRLGDEFQRLTGRESETLQAGANMLLTFVNVRNEVGKGNDIFSQAVELIGDYAIATGTDASSAAIMFGKALNDPIQGLTALAKVGAIGRAEAEALRKKWGETTSTMEMQKDILAALAEQFGESTEEFAKTSEAAAARVKANWGEFKEGFASGVLPAIDAATAAMDKLGSHGESAGEKLGNLISRAWVASISFGTSEVSNLQAKIRELIFGADEHAAASTRAKGAIEGETGAIQGQTGALEANTAAQEASTTAALARISSSVAASESELRFKDQVDQVTKSLQGQDPASRQSQQALIDLQQAALSTAGAQVRLAEDAAAAAGSELSAAEKAGIMKTALERLRDSVAPGSPLYAALQALIDQINNIPTKKHITITASYPGDIGGRPPPGYAGPPTAEARAAGGPVRAGEPYVVGEDGPELMVPNQSGTIIPAGAGGSFAAGGAAMATPTVQLIVQGSLIGLDERDLAERLHTALLRKQRRNNTLGFR